MAFERFTKTGRGYKPKVGIWSRGQIGFNQGCVQKMKLNDYKFVIFFYDKENNKIGFKFTNDNNEDGIIKLNIRKTGATVSAKSFLDYYEIDHSETKRYEVEYSDEDGMWILELK